MKRLTLKSGETFQGETIHAIAKAALQAGVAYVGGYPGAPVSHLLDTFAAAKSKILEPLGVHFEQSGSEAGAAALLGASVQYPLRGLVTWKSVVGTNVAADALSNLASAGVTGGAMVVVGEDYGEGASVIQERTHSIALKSSLPLIDPRYDQSKIVDLVEQGFELSEACHLPVIMSLRIRAAHMTGSFVCKDNKPAPKGPMAPRFDFNKIVLPPSCFAQEADKVENRLPAARQFIQDHGLNETFGGNGRYGIILQGGAYGVVMRSLQRLGLADAFGKTDVPMLVLNVIHPLVPDQIKDFLSGKAKVLVVEEGNPAHLETQIAAIAQEHGLKVALHGKDLLPLAGEYTTPVVRRGVAAFIRDAAPKAMAEKAARAADQIAQSAAGAQALANGINVPPRPPTFCSGCPERPVFTALKLLMEERGPIHISSDIGCNSFATNAPFAMGSTIVGYGLSLASGGAVGRALDQPVVAVMGDGGFWHNGFSTGAVNAQWNNYDAVLVILDNGYAAATGHQNTPSSGKTAWGAASRVSIEDALRGIGVTWVRRADAYRVEETKDALAEALDARNKGLRVIIVDNECMLAKKRRGNRHKAKAAQRGEPTQDARFGVDAEVCTGDHSCIRLSGCPSLSVRHTGDPLKDGPTAWVDPNCVACSLCGEAAHAARLCPSFYRASGVRNATRPGRMIERLRKRVLQMMGSA